MRRVQKVLTGIFLSGILMGGIGTGIAKDEYSTMAMVELRELTGKHIIWKTQLLMMHTLAMIDNSK